MTTALYYINDSATPVRASSPAAAVAADLRAAGYTARAHGTTHVRVSADVAEMLGGVVNVASKAIMGPCQVTLG
jgi:cytosine/adenosine deaminase-related metal-dependent hydrolase